MIPEKSILIADDSATVRQLIRTVLKKRPGLTFSEANDGQAALEQLTQRPFDLLVTDINMPNLDGLGLVRLVRTRLGSFMPIIIVTTRGGDKDRDRGMELGASAYITKPINASALLKLVEKLIP
jgi:two-component system chemotaxis response regulator CheY